MINEKIEHESFAVLQISRVNCSGHENLFGSSIQHQHMIEMRIVPAYIYRDLSMDFIGSHNTPYITVQMSNSQFAEAITSMNMGVGTPVTLKSLINADGEYKKMQSPPEEDKRAQIDNEFADTMENMALKLDKQKREILTLCERMPKKFQKDIEIKIGSMYREIHDYIPFIKKQFTEQMDKTTLEAKGEIEGFIMNKVTTLGLKGLKDMKLLPENKNQDETRI